MTKKDIIELMREIRRDDKDTINKLISTNERILYEVRDVISKLQQYLKSQEKKEEE